MTAAADTAAVDTAATNDDDAPADTTRIVIDCDMLVRTILNVVAPFCPVVCVALAVLTLPLTLFYAISPLPLLFVLFVCFFARIEMLQRMQLAAFEFHGAAFRLEAVRRQQERRREKIMHKYKATVVASATIAVFMTFTIVQDQLRVVALSTYDAACLKALWVLVALAVVVALASAFVDEGDYEYHYAAPRRARNLFLERVAAATEDMLLWVHDAVTAENGGGGADTHPPLHPAVQPVVFGLTVAAALLEVCFIIIVFVQSLRLRTIYSYFAPDERSLTESERSKVDRCSFSSSPVASSGSSLFAFSPFVLPLTVAALLLLRFMWINIPRVLEDAGIRLELSSLVQRWVSRGALALTIVSLLAAVYLSILPAVDAVGTADGQHGGTGKLCVLAPCSSSPCSVKSSSSSYGCACRKWFAVGAGSLVFIGCARLPLFVLVLMATLCGCRACADGDRDADAGEAAAAPAGGGAGGREFDVLPQDDGGGGDAAGGGAGTAAVEATPVAAAPVLEGVLAPPPRPPPAMPTALAVDMSNTAAADQVCVGVVVAEYN